MRFSNNILARLDALENEKYYVQIRLGSLEFSDASESEKAYETRELISHINSLDGAISAFRQMAEEIDLDQFAFA